MAKGSGAEGLLRYLAERDRTRRIALLSDVRFLHRRLFVAGRGLARGGAGRFRHPSDPDQGMVCVMAQAPGLALKHDVLPAHRVGCAMRQFKDQMRALLTLPPADVPDALAHVLAELVLIHPFADGNGRTARLLVSAAADHLGQRMTADWTVTPRPHGPGFDFALRAYPCHPAPFLAYMRRYFAPKGSDADHP